MNLPLEIKEKIFTYLPIEKVFFLSRHAFSDKCLDISIWEHYIKNNNVKMIMLIHHCSLKLPKSTEILKVCIKLDKIEMIGFLGDFYSNHYKFDETLIAYFDCYFNNLYKKLNCSI